MQRKWSFIWGFGLGVGIAGVALASLFQMPDRPLANSSARPKIAGNSFEGGYLQAKQVYEEYWQQKINAAIAYVPGAIVAVEVHIADTHSQVEYAVANDERPVICEHAERLGDGVERTTHQCVSKHVNRIARSAFLPESVRVVVSAPRSYLRRVAVARSGTSSVDRIEVAEAETLITNQLKETIVSLIPPPDPGNDPYPTALVTWFDDSPQVRGLTTE